MMKFKVIDTDLEGTPLRMRSMGRGVPLFVFPGGPGLSGSYFEGYLTALAEHRTLWIFDPLGCGGSRVTGREVSAEDTLWHAAKAFAKYADSGGGDILAHSWGTYLLGGIVGRAELANVQRVIFANPVPPTRDGLTATGAALVGRVPPEIAEQIGALAAENTPDSGREMMRKGLPYYCGRSENLPALNFEYYNDVYNSVLETAGDYDHCAALDSLADRARVIFGTTDHITPNLFFAHAGEKLRAAPAHVIDGGHFSFADSPDAFTRAVLE